MDNKLPECNYTERLVKFLSEKVWALDGKTVLTQIMFETLNEEEKLEVGVIDELSGTRDANGKIAKLMLTREKEVESALAEYLCKVEGAIEGFYRESKMGAQDFGLEEFRKHMVELRVDKWFRNLTPAELLAFQKDPTSIRTRIDVKMVLFDGDDTLWIKKGERSLPSMRLHMPNGGDPRLVAYGSFIERYSLPKKDFPFVQTRFYSESSDFDSFYYFVFPNIRISQAHYLVEEFVKCPFWNVQESSVDLVQYFRTRFGKTLTL